MHAVLHPPLPPSATAPGLFTLRGAGDTLYEGAIPVAVQRRKGRARALPMVAGRASHGKEGTPFTRRWQEGEGDTLLPPFYSTCDCSRVAGGGTCTCSTPRTGRCVSSWCGGTSRRTSTRGHRGVTTKNLLAGHLPRLASSSDGSRSTRRRGTRCGCSCPVDRRRSSTPPAAPRSTASRPQQQPVPA